MSASNWKTCPFTRKEIDRAGLTLREELYGLGFGLDAIEQYLEAYRVMDAWRASHAFPLNTIQMTLRRRAAMVEPFSQIVQRMKRGPSVVSKLKRYPDMQLSRMQDLGGCRAILSSVENVYKVREAYGKSRDRHELVTEKDYIAEPQSSGYRGVHLVFRYRSDRTSQYNGHRVEVQLRTRVQHAWATAVEVAGIFTRTSLKSSIGPEEWLEFFRFASSIFSAVEGSSRLHPELEVSNVVKRLLDLEGRIDALRKLENFTAAHEYISTNRRKSDTHFIIILDIDQRKTTVEAFPHVSMATDRYAMLESKNIGNPLIDVVLVAAENIENLTTAYPNYFADTSDFLSLLRLAIKDFE